MGISKKRSVMRWFSLGVVLTGMLTGCMNQQKKPLPPTQYGSGSFPPSSAQSMQPKMGNPAPAPGTANAQAKSVSKQSMGGSGSPNAFVGVPGSPSQLPGNGPASLDPIPSAAPMNQPRVSNSPIHTPGLAANPPAPAPVGSVPMSPGMQPIAVSDPSMPAIRQVSNTSIDPSTGRINAIPEIKDPIPPSPPLLPTGNANPGLTLPMSNGATPISPNRPAPPPATILGSTLDDVPPLPMGKSATPSFQLPN